MLPVPPSPIHRRNTTPRFRASLARALAAALLLSGIPTVAGAQEAAVGSILRDLRASTVLAGAGAQVWRHLVEAGGLGEGPGEEGVYAAVAEAFTLPLLLGDVQEVLSDEPRAGALEEVSLWLTSGANARLRSAMDARPASGSLDDFMDEVLVSPPPRSRSELVLRWTEAQGAADFYVLVGESAREAAARILEAAFDSDPSALRSGPEQLLIAREEILAAAFLSFLRQLDGVPDEEIVAAATEYESEAGQWFVQRYRVAVAVALRRAGERAALRIAGPGAER
jgi:hypothetical protein